MAETYTTEETCRANGGVWENGACRMYEKADPYAYKEATPKVSEPTSETERLEQKQLQGLPIAESVKSTMQGEVKGLGETWRKLDTRDDQRLLNERMTEQAQQFAAKGMSFSSPMLAAQKDTLREYSKQRQMSKDQADKMQMELNIQAYKNAEPIEQLAVAGRLGILGQGFTPGKIPENLYLDEQFGLEDPEGFSGLPTDWPGKNMGESEPEIDENTEFTDSTGVTCKLGEVDELRRCPDNPQFGTGAEGGPD